MPQVDNKLLMLCWVFVLVQDLDKVLKLHLLLKVMRQELKVVTKCLNKTVILAKLSFIQKPEQRKADIRWMELVWMDAQIFPEEIFIWTLKHELNFVKINVFH